MKHFKTIGPVSAKLLSSLYSSNKIIFILTDIEKITGLRGGASRDFASKLIKRNVIARIKSGKYIILPQELGKETNYIGNWYVVAREIVNSPNYYISHYSAMDIHDMLSHPITKVFVTTPKQEYKKLKTVGNTAFELIYTSAKNIWGIQKIWVTKSEQVRVSDIERTIIDCLYHPKYSGGIMEIVRGLWIQKGKINFEKLLAYIFKFNKVVVIKRLGYILEKLDLRDANYLSKLRKKINNKYYVLDPLLSTERTYKNSWKLIVNISPEEISKGATT